MVNLTTVQKSILNDISKYEPAWRDFGNLTPGEGFGDKMQSMVAEFDIIRSEINISTLQVKEVDITNLSPNIINIFEGNQEIFISDILIKVLEPFNDSAAMSIGTDLNNELLLSLNESDLNEVIEFITFPKTKVSDSIKLFFNSAGSSSGQAKIILNLR